jgi:hypothetical protein
MPISLTMLQSDIDFMITDLPTAVTWQGTAYSCVVSDITSEDDLELAGIIEGKGFVIVISLDDFTNGTPDTGQRVSIAGKNYRIGSFSDSPDGLARTLTCVGDTQ